MKLILSVVARRAMTLFYQYTDYRIYRYDLSIAPKPELADHFSKNRDEDLKKFVSTERWHDRDMIIEDWRKRLQGGWSIYTYCNETTLLHYGWVRPKASLYLLYEVGRQFSFPPASVGLWDFYTHPNARGQGLYQQNLATMLHDLSKEYTYRYAYIGVVADNGPSRHVIEKLGFEYRGSIVRRQILGYTQLKSTFPYTDPEIE